MQKSFAIREKQIDNDRVCFNLNYHFNLGTGNDFKVFRRY